MVPRFFEPEIETASRETLIRLQTERVREQVQHA
jgi:phenylacetate-coenzyme A ligase PaaK-like adenylate-forming protein